MTAVLIDAILLSIFAISHSVMARKGFKEKWTKIVPQPIERSTYVLVASLSLLLLFWQWRPFGNVIWDVTGTIWVKVLWGVFGLGWVLVLVSTILINHFELFGLRQVFYHLKGKEAPAIEFKTPGLYKMVRHPIYLGFTLAFWATPVMTTPHLVFAIATLGYILVGIFLEEKDLVGLFGDKYTNYKRRVSMLFPLPPKKDG